MILTTINDRASHLLSLWSKSIQHHVITNNNSYEYHSSFGPFSLNYVARDKHTNEIVFIKRVRLDTGEDGIPSGTLREISLLRGLSHENIIDLRDCVQEAERLNLVFELVEKDLKRCMFDELLDPVLVKSYLFQLCRGVAFCHARGVMHRNLKPHNLLVSCDGVLKLADFELARSLCPPIQPLTHEVVTLWYRPPEILLGSETYALPVDTWSIGATFFEMVTNRPLFPGQSEIDQLFKIFRQLGTPNEQEWPGVTSMQDWNTSFPIWYKSKFSNTFLDNVDSSGVDLLERFLAYNPVDRITARDSMNHSFFDDILHKELQNNVRLESIKLLKKGLPFALSHVDSNGALPLHLACEHHESPSVAQYLLSLETRSLQAVDYDNNTILHYACRGANYGIIAMLLKTHRHLPISQRNAHNELPIQLLWESNKVVDRESINYVDSVFLLLKAFPEMYL